MCPILGLLLLILLPHNLDCWMKLIRDWHQITSWGRSHECGSSVSAVFKTVNHWRYFWQIQCWTWQLLKHVQRSFCFTAMTMSSDEGSQQNLLMPLCCLFRVYRVWECLLFYCWEVLLLPNLCFFIASSLNPAKYLITSTFFVLVFSLKLILCLYSWKFLEILNFM